MDPSGHWCDRKEQVYQGLLKEEGFTADMVDPDTQLRLMAEAANRVKGKTSSNPGGSDAGSPRQPDFIGSDNGLIVPIDVYNMSNPDFIQHVADIANLKINEQLIKDNKPTTGHVAGTLKHGEAAQIIKDYQRYISDRGLEVETSYLNGGHTPNNLTPADIHEINPR